MVGVLFFGYAKRKEVSDALSAWPSVNHQDDRCADSAAVVEQGWARKYAASHRNPQDARLQLATAIVGAGSGMMPRVLPTRRGLQALALVLAAFYATILVYQAVAPRQVIRTIVIALAPTAMLTAILTTPPPLFRATPRRLSAIRAGGIGLLREILTSCNDTSYYEN